MSGSPDPRLLAVKVIVNLLQQQQKLSLLIPDYTKILDSARDQAFLRELCYGVARWYFQLDIIVDYLLDRKLKSRDLDIRIVAILGLYQFLYTRVPDHAVISTTVNLCTRLKKVWAKNLVNALLRRFQRERETILKNLEDNINFQFSHPDWLIEILQKYYPDKWQEICQANNQHAPMVLRVNNLKISRDDYLKLLLESGIEAVKSEICGQGIILMRAVDVDLLPEFSRGYCSVQDLAAQLVPGFMQLDEEQKVLDACSAPGGKLMHLIESGVNPENIIALEPELHRYRRTQENLERAGLTTNLKNANALITDEWWDGNYFDRILLDTPCSATGVIRRQPDIKLLRTSKDIETITQLQNDLLCNLWQVLKPGGKLLYVTCSVLPLENELHIEHFLDTHKNAKFETLTCKIGHPVGCGWQILPGQDNTDGFFYALLEKFS